MFDKRTTATALAALRYWQRGIERHLGKCPPDPEVTFNLVASQMMPLHFEDEAPLNSSEIDELCEHINCSEETKTETHPEDELAIRLSRYVRTGGVNCPFCGDSDIVGDSYEHEEGYVTQDIRCSACGKSWRDTLTLTDVTPLEE